MNSRDTAKTIIAYGDSGTYKSTNARFFALYMYKKFKRPVRLISVEASTATIFQDTIAAGIVEPVFLIKPANPLPAFRKLAKGQWPTKDHQAWMSVPVSDITAPCAYIWEGLTSTGDIFLEDLREKARQIGQDVVGKFIEEDEQFSKAAPSHYDFVQMELLRLVRGFSSLPIERLLITAHEAKGEDEDTRQSIRGPGLVGKARTAAVQKWCGTLLHFEAYPEVVSVPVAGSPEKTLTVTRNRVRAWFQRHPDPVFVNISYPAKTTIPSESFKKLWEAYPGGFFEPSLTDGLDKFLEVEAGVIESSVERLTEWKQKIDKSSLEDKHGN